MRGQRLIVLLGAFLWGAHPASGDSTQYLPVPKQDLLRHEYVVLANMERPGVFVAIPSILDFYTDTSTGKAKFGFQYANYEGPNTTDRAASLSVTLVLSRNQQKLQSLRRALKATDIVQGIALSYELVFFRFENNRKNASLKKVSEGSASTDGTFAVSLDLSDLSGPEVRKALDGGESGLLLYFRPSLSMGYGEHIAITGANIADALGTFGFINSSIGVTGVSELVAETLAKQGLPSSGPPAGGVQAFSRPSVKAALRRVINEIIGAPVPSFDSFGKLRVGWELSSPEVIEKATALGMIELSLATTLDPPDTFAAVIAFKSLCSRFKEQIVNLDRFETGCSGLTK